ncbi:hypothetical protein Hanom_Chr16g01452391 [Helianthus anomalus]
MVCSARLLDVSYPLTSSFCSYVSPAHHNSRYFCTNPKSTVRWRSMSLSDPDVSMDASAASIDADSAAKNAAGLMLCSRNLRKKLMMWTQRLVIVGECLTG